VIALDGKVNFDDSALFRHKDVLAYRDLDEENPLEVAASNFNLSYIALDGNVGNMVNGAGLAMATMDIIKQAGASPANFLDVGGGANAEMAENGFRITLSDKKEAAVFIKQYVTKPVIGFIAGLTAPPGRRMGHAGAIISGSSGTGHGKIAAMKACGITVCENLGTLGESCFMKTVDKM
jgi:succinyl-CoA synthetase beta subunit